MLMRVVPVRPGVGVMVRMRLLPVPVTTRLVPRCKTLFVERQMMLSDARFSKSSTVKGIGGGKVPLVIVRSGGCDTTGGSFVAITVNVKERLVGNKPSPTTIVMVAEPDWLATGVRTALRFAPEPVKLILLVGIRPVLDDTDRKRRFAAGVSTSATCSGMVMGTSSMVV